MAASPGLAVGIGLAVTAPSARSVFQAAKSPSSALIMRQRADQGVTVATGVSQWNDLTGGVQHLVQAAGASQPTFSAAGGSNGTPCVTSNGSSHIMSTAANVSYGAFTRHLVYKGTGAGIVVEHLSAADGDFIYSNAAGPNTQVSRASVTTARTLTASTAWGTDAAWRYVTQRFSGLNTSHRFELSGVEPAATSGATGDPGSAVSANPYNVFARVSGGLFAAGSLCEHMLWNKALNEHDMARVQKYAQGRYAL